MFVRAFRSQTQAKRKLRHEEGENLVRASSAGRLISLFVSHVTPLTQAFAEKAEKGKRKLERERNKFGRSESLPPLRLKAACCGLVLEHANSNSANINININISTFRRQLAYG